MTTGQMLRNHLLIPLAVFVGLLIAGVSVGTALFVGMMSGCLGMMFRHGHHSSDTGERSRPGDD